MPSTHLLRQLTSHISLTHHLPLITTTEPPTPHQLHNFLVVLTCITSSVYKYDNIIQLLTHNGPHSFVFVLFLTAHNSLFFSSPSDRSPLSFPRSINRALSSFHPATQSTSTVNSVSPLPHFCSLCWCLFSHRVLGHLFIVLCQHPVSRQYILFPPPLSIECLGPLNRFHQTFPASVSTALHASQRCWMPSRVHAWQRL